MGDSKNRNQSIMLIKTTVLNVWLYVNFSDVSVTKVLVREHVESTSFMRRAFISPSVPFCQGILVRFFPTCCYYTCGFRSIEFNFEVSIDPLESIDSKKKTIWNPIRTVSILYHTVSIDPFSFLF